MGCWNATCLLSNLPIHFGEKILAIPIAETYYPHNGDYAYPDSVYLPFMPPVYGRYNGYGAVEDYDVITVEVAEYFFQTLQEKGALCGVEAEDSLQDLFSMLGRGDVYFRYNGNPKKLRTSVALVRQNVFEALKAQAQKEDVYCQMLQESEALWQKIQAWPRVSAMDVVDACDQLFRYMSRTPHCYLRQIGLEMLLKFSGLEIAKVPFWDLISMNYILLQLRRGYLPSGGLGSQDTVTSIMKALYATGLNIIDKG